jgi:hypothetical protein
MKTKRYGYFVVGTFLSVVDGLDVEFESFVDLALSVFEGVGAGCGDGLLVYGL